MADQVPVRATPPSGELVSIDEAKAHLRVDGSDEDGLITALVAAATAYVDGYCGILGRAVLQQRWEWSIEAFPASDRIRLPLGDLIASPAPEIAYYDSANVAQSFTAFTAMTDAIGPMLVLDDGAIWPGTAIRPDAVTISWDCGYGAAASDVPADIILAIKMLVAHWYANREAVTGTDMADLPFGSRMLLERYRKIGL